MHLTPRENERLLVFTTAELARRRLKNGLKLNYPEAVAIISDELMEQAVTANKLLADIISFGTQILSQEDVLPGVRELIPIIQVEGMFLDGSKLITVHDPIRIPTRSEIGNQNYFTLDDSIFTSSRSEKVNQTV
ncbi:urease gamma subunit [Peribacillus huizhouensis]|uniref:Urease subunit gamma n=1 Tax=Peribacillus huizhouensis TaxID=1501239 RepID=A0ABR6CKI0_9BACI|nr:urease gamma subunit [Peribacillus huizhouensis]